LSEGTLYSRETSQEKTVREDRETRDKGG
jgi:hypothetical protein